MIKNIVFDIGNVLVSFRWKEYFQEFGYDEETLDRLAKATALSPAWNEFDLGALSDEEILQGFIKNDPQLEPVIREVLTTVTGLLGRYDYAIPWLKDLKAKGYNLYYLSNFSRRADADCGDVLDFLPYMDGGILSYQDKVIKPDPAIYQLLLNRYGLKAEECVFMDDSEKNVIAARKEGFYGIVFRNQEQAIEELEKLGIKC